MSADISVSAGTGAKTRAKDKRQSRVGEIWRRLKVNKGAVVGLTIILLLMMMAVFAPCLAPYDPNKMNSGPRLSPPTEKNLMGTDQLGRDQLSRIIYGARISLYVGFIAVGIGATCGGFIGALVGFYGGRVDAVLMRIMDVLLAVPQTILTIAIVGSLGPNLINLMAAVGISQIPRYARIVRASSLSVRGQEFIEAARAIGASDLRIIVENILPNCMAPIIVQSTLGVAASILTAAALSFLGLGIQPPTPEWGSMLSLGRQYMRNAPHLTLFPGLVIAVVVMSLNIFGDGLRDALDPKLRQ